MRLRTVRQAGAWVATVCAASCGVLLSGCDVSIRDGSVSVGAFAGRASDEWTRRYPLATGGRVEVVNLNGPIDVVAGEEGAVDVRVIRTARALADETAREQLKALTIEEKVSGNLVHLETRRSIPAGRASLEVHYHVLVPPSAEVNVVTTNGAVSVGSLTGAVRASSTNGSVTGASLSGKVDFTTVNGSIHVDLSGVAAAGISLKSVNGSVELKVPQQARASVSAKCVNGRVAVTGLPVAAAEQRRQRAFQAQLNGGGPSIEVETTNGVVRIDGKS